MKAKYNGTWYNDVYQYSNGCILIKELGKAFDPDELECLIHRERPVHKNKSGFFMVYVEGGRGPSYVHEDLCSAEEEAKRLALLTGRETYVLASYKSYLIKNMEESKCVPNVDDLPF